MATHLASTDRGLQQFDSSASLEDPPRSRSLPANSWAMIRLRGSILRPAAGSIRKLAPCVLKWHRSNRGIACGGQPMIAANRWAQSPSSVDRTDPW